MGENNILVELIVLQKKKRFEMHFIFGLTNYIVWKWDTNIFENIQT
jgi:hypothetical protein